MAALAVALWAVAAIDVATPTWRLRSGQVKGTDFVHFYTLAQLGASGRASDFADVSAQRAVQVVAVPESSDDWFAPAYGPQVALALAPLGRVPYGTALVWWLAATTVVYFALVLILVQSTVSLRRHTGLVILAAAAFPAFWTLIVHGQLSIVAMAILVAAWAALRSKREAYAGALLGLLWYKPSLAAGVFAVLLFARAWRVLVPALVTGFGQVAVAAYWVGMPGLVAYIRLLLDAPRLAVVLASKVDQMHSWRAFWLLLVPSPRLAAALYAVSALATILAAARLWRRQGDASLRMAALTVATVLASPHLYVYDLIVLAPVWIWLTEWYLTRPNLPAAVGRTLYLGYAMPLVAAAFTRVLRLQLVTLCLSLLLVWMWRCLDDASQNSADVTAADGRKSGKDLTYREPWRAPITT